MTPREKRAEAIAKTGLQNQINTKTAQLERIRKETADLLVKRHYTKFSQAERRAMLLEDAISDTHTQIESVAKRLNSELDLLKWSVKNKLKSINDKVPGKRA